MSVWRPTAKSTHAKRRGVRVSRAGAYVVKAAESRAQSVPAKAASGRPAATDDDRRLAEAFLRLAR